MSRLVVPGDPLKSILLTNPLDTEAGGGAWHGGGKHWHSQNDPEWQTLAAWVRTQAGASARARAQRARPRLNYDTFKTEGAADPDRGAQGQRALHRLPLAWRRMHISSRLPPGSETYSEEQSRRNFDRVSRLVVPGDPLKSVLLTNPLDTEAGGGAWHGGGKHWHSQNDPEWQALAAWVRGS